MGRRSEDDRDAIDQAFAEIVAGYERTADDRELNWQDSAAIEFEGEPDPPPEAESQGKSLPELNTAWADEHPLFRFEPPPPEPEAPEEPEERFTPEPPPPLERPAWPVLLGWLGMAYAVLALLATALGVQLPTWAGWLAVIGFVGAVTILVVRLPRRRPPDSGNGAVL